MEYIYIIIKSSRNGIWPYSGPSCNAAGIPPGRYYHIEIDAMKDCNKLNAVNPVGFTVYGFKNLGPIEHYPT